MDNLCFLENLKKHGLVIVIRASSHEIAMKTVDACYEAGARLIEITFTVPEADILIGKVKEKYSGTDLVLGAGTVLDLESANKAIAKGADFVVSPCLVPNLYAAMREKNCAYVPGIFSPSELMTALNEGADLVKLFPGDIAKPQGLKALKGPFPNVSIMPTGGVGLDNLEEWFSAGAIAVGAGSNITKASKNGDYDAVKKETELWLKKIAEIKKNK